MLVGGSLGPSTFCANRITMKHYSILALTMLSLAAAGCKSDEPEKNIDDIIDIGPGTTTEHPAEYYAGGVLGTTSVVNAYAYQQPTPAIEQAGMGMEFQNGETLFERDYNENKDGAFTGLGPLAVRPGCLYCHPNYGHGKRQERYRATDMGNGYLLVIYDKKTDAYVMSVAGMPQTMATKPFKAPVDEAGISPIEWKTYVDEWGNKFPDGETYELIYPEVSISADAFYAPVVVKRDGQMVTIPADQVADEIGVKLESTIGIYGTGLTDAIPDEEITKQWIKESEYYNSIGKTDALNPTYWDQAGMKWTNKYKNTVQGNGTEYVRRYTYALSRGPLLDAAGANAIWNITNVTRSDRRYHYLDLAGTYYAKTAMNDKEVQAEFPEYIESIDPDKKHPEWRTDDVAQNIYNYLTGKNQDPEMSDQQYKNLMIWHRGLAVPAARNVGTEKFNEGKRLFSELHCDACHRPSWTTGEDHIQDPNLMFSDADMPRYPKQTIWPYTDFVQHRLHMVNDIRTGWCRTTPLWGRGLSKLCTGAEDRLHDCRARNTLEAIMWHGNAKSDARGSIEAFRKLSAEERAAVVYFCESI